ncbi:MAG TPA: DNA primase small subunit PriS [Thermoplasmata archaeon]|nr:DNA primase small subunit PriS [Thermoplasmata archaeon]
MPADDRTPRFLREAFQRHYKSPRLRAPDRLRKREFAFMPFAGGIMQRHLGFVNLNELRTHLVNRVPAHAYYSSAYYERPGAPTMDEKGWQGADLVFDLDADHLPGAKGMTFEAMLAEVKRLFVRLVDEFLLGELGFQEASLLTVFSGGRGYHAHVRDPRVLSLGSHERRELVDYITGKDLDLELYVSEPPIYAVEFKGRRQVRRTVKLPRQDEPGWRGRFTRAFEAWLDSLAGMPREDAIKEVTEVAGVTPRAAASLFKRVFEDPDLPLEVVKQKLREGIVEFFPTETKLGAAALRRIQEQRGIPLAKAETDEPVTSDIKRLIRLPTSIHGKTGLEVVAMSRAELDAFDPLRDAVPAVYGDAAVRVSLEKPLEIRLRDETFNLSPGLTEVPEYAAVFLAARGVARLP